MRIAVDAMGGDNAPREILEGAILAVKKWDIDVLLVGKERLLQRLLKAKRFESPKLKIIHAPDVVKMDEHPKDSLRKKESSLAIAVGLVKKGEADGLVAAGNTGAVHANTLFSWRTLPGINRPAIASLYPSMPRPVVLIDCGANVDSKPRNLLQFAVMGSVFMREVYGRHNPRVGLVSIGEEDTKGNELVLKTGELLRNSTLNFVGNVEGKDVINGKIDIAVCDGFVGNIILKFSEALGELMFGFLKGQARENIIVKLGALGMMPAFKKLKKQVDYAEYGGAPLLGLNGFCIICHGKSDRRAISNAIRVANEAGNHNCNQHIIEELEKNNLSQNADIE